MIYQRYVYVMEIQDVPHLHPTEEPWPMTLNEIGVAH